MSAERERAILELTGEVRDVWAGFVGTHYEGCWTVHTACLAAVIEESLRPE